MSSLRRLPFLALVLGLASCTEYDLGHKDDPEPPPDTGDTPPDPVNPDIRVYCADDPSCASLDFGSVMQGCESDRQGVTIENVGAGDLYVTDMTFDGGGASYFSHDGTAPALAPGDTYTFGVQFKPGAQASYTPQLQVASNDPDTPVAGLVVAGTGAEFSTYEESFTQGSYSAVDVLWLTDNSGSMIEEINMVTEYYEDFINNFVDVGLDFHIGVTTVDMDSPTGAKGKLLGPVKYATADMTKAEAIDAFTSAVNVAYANEGSGTERGFDASKAALTDPLSSGDNAGFLRDVDEYGNEVALAVVVVSDEEEQSSGTVTQYVTWLKGLKSDPTKATFSAVTGDPPDSSNWLGGCMNTTYMTSADAGQRYYDAANESGGFWVSICTNDFSAALTFLSVHAAGMENEFPLRYEPTSVSSMTVQVDGVDASYYSAATGNGWKYDTDANSIVFYGDSIPDPGATIYVSYEYDPGC